MTPYRERREQGFYHPEGETPESVHSHHVSGLQTATHPPEEQPDPIDESTIDDPDALDEMTKAELLDLAKERGISPANAAMSKGELREALENA